MKEITIDLSEIRTQDDFHDCIERDYPVPSYYGRNLDALNDIWSDIHEETNIVIRGYDHFEETLPAYCKSFEDMIIALTGRNENVTFDLIEQEEDDAYAVY